MQHFNSFVGALSTAQLASYVGGTLSSPPTPSLGSPDPLAQFSQSYPDPVTGIVPLSLVDIARITLRELFPPDTPPIPMPLKR